MTAEETLGYISVGCGEKNLVLIHGLASDSGFWLPLVSKIDKNEYTVHLVDLRGHGKSTFKNRSLLPCLLAKDIYALCRERRIRRPLFVCHSFGGRVGLNLMQEKEVNDDVHLLILDTYWPEFQERPSVRAVLERSEDNMLPEGLSDDDIPVSATKSLEIMRRRLSKRGEGVKKKKRNENIKIWDEIMKDQDEIRRIDEEVDQGIVIERIKSARDRIHMIYGSNSIFIKSGIYARDKLGIECEILANARHFFPRSQPETIADKISEIIW